MRGFLVLLALLVCPMLEAKEEQRKCAMGRDYWLYTPDNIDAKKTYWLVVGVHGFSGGSQYAHRFTNKHPKNVIGVSAHSGGSWDEGPDAAAKSVLWTISCGLKDTALSMPDSKMSRIDFFTAIIDKAQASPIKVIIRIAVC